MKKRILSFVLALVMAVSLLPVSVLAAEDTPAVQAEYLPPDSDVKVIGKIRMKYRCTNCDSKIQG